MKVERQTDRQAEGQTKVERQLQVEGQTKVERQLQVEGQTKLERKEGRAKSAIVLLNSLLTMHMLMRYMPCAK